MKKVLESGWLSQGPVVKKFEEGLARYVGGRHALATTSCTTALLLALNACRIPSGSEVIVPDFTFPATGNVVLLNGSIPVIVDVDLRTMAIDPAEVEKAMTSKTSGVIVVHPFGAPADLDPIRELCRKRGVALIQDAATALGTEYRGRRVGKTGEAVCFSFHPRKLLTTGEGGALVTDSDEVLKRGSMLRNHGEVDSPEGKRFVLPGNNYRMSDIQAAVGVAQLAKFDGLVRERREQAKVYADLIRDANIDLVPPWVSKEDYSTFQSYVVRLGPAFRTPRNQVIGLMKSRHSIETQIGTYSLHLEPSFAGAVKVGKLERGEQLFRSTLTLPLYHGLTETDQARVIEGLKSLSVDS